MSTVRKAYDMQTGQFVALKFLSRISDEIRSKNAFFREFNALESLNHKNIVRIIEANRTENGKSFLVLEWLEERLEEAIEKSPVRDYEDFMSRYGAQILDAIVYAQSLKYAHRDIKPKNILLTDDGIPKIADYGIAKYVDGLLPNSGTLAHFGSPPFTPKEDDDGFHTFTRDVYSFAALTIASLAGGVFKSDEEEKLTKEQKYDRLREVFISQKLPPDLAEILERCLSDSPSNRFPTASALQAKLEAFELHQRQSVSAPKRKCYLFLRDASINAVGRQLDDHRLSRIERTVLEEIGEAFSFSKYRLQGRSETAENELTLWGITWAFQLKPKESDRSVFEVVRAWQMGPAEIARLREDGCVLPLQFSFSRPPGPIQGRNLTGDVIAAVAAYESEKEHAAKAAEKEQFFRRMYAFLSAKSEIERRTQERINYHSRTVVGDSATLTTDVFVSNDFLGEERVIKLASGFVIRCEVIEVRSKEIDVTPLNSSPMEIPVTGTLSVNTRQMARAIERQRIALDSVFYNRCVNPSLKSFLIEPASIPQLQPIENIETVQSEIDSDKLDALRATLGTESVVAIQGPPGTGKTTLIAEIVIQYLKLHPKHRILLSSQTHIALDNVIERILSVSGEVDVVRIGKPDDPKITESVKPLLLDSKVQAWAKAVSENASRFLEDWAESSGVDKAQISIGIRVEELLAVLKAHALVREKVRAAKAEKEGLDTKQDEHIDTKGGVISDEIDLETEEAQEQIESLELHLRALKDKEQVLRRELAQIADYGQELSVMSFDDLKEWLDLFLPDDPRVAHCRKVIEISEEWLLRVGKTQDFYPAILGSSQVIAGTCIGMASVPGIQEVSFDLCIIDEASKATPTEVLVPMARSRSWVLVGDPKQLPPFVEQELLEDVELMEEFGLSAEHLRVTLLERLLDTLPVHSAKRLKRQYRMVAGIGDLVSKCFYGGMLQSPKKEADLSLLPSFSKPVTWLTTSAAQHRFEQESGVSSKNRFEASIVLQALNRIEFVAKTKKKRISVAIIAGYAAQVEEINRTIDRGTRLSKWLTISCNTVDAFQGRQADVCIYSVTRSNPARKIGFLREFPRLNVALSRAKSYLIIVGDHVFCRSAQGRNPFAEVISYIENNPESCTVEEVQ